MEINKRVNKENKENKEKDIAFRIVKERWFHRYLDNLIKKIYGISPATQPIYQIHLSTYLVKKFGRWVAYDHNQINKKKSYNLSPTISHQKEWAEKEKEHNESNKKHKYMETGFEIDMSDVGKLTEEDRLRRKEKDNETKKKLIEIEKAYFRSKEENNELTQIEQKEILFENDYEKNKEKFYSLLDKIEDPVVKEVLDTLHDMCTSFSIYYVAKYQREELGELGLEDPI